MPAARQAVFRTLSLMFATLVLTAILILPEIHRVDASAEHSGDIAKSVACARSSTDEHHAVACLADAVGALNARLDGLASGELPFDGQIYLPKGFAVTKPSASEDK